MILGDLTVARNSAAAQKVLGALKRSNWNLFVRCPIHVLVMPSD